MDYILVLLPLIVLAPPCILGTVEQDLAKQNGDFALNMYKELGTQTEGNIFFSPFSISMAMAMVLLGAKEKTKAEMVDGMKLSDITDPHQAFNLLRGTLTGTQDFELSLANRLFSSKVFEPLTAYLDGTKQYYGAEMQKLDFIGDAEGSRNTINDWVEDQTNNKIQDFLPEGFINAQTAMVLVNAIYFKGTWKRQFNATLTVDGAFHQGGGKSVQLKMMTMSDEKFRYAESADLGAKLLAMPYEGDKLDMVIVLPDEIEGLEDVESKLTIDKLHTALNLLSSPKKIKTVKVPKLKLEQEANLVDRLKALGITDLFNPQSANLTGISDTVDLFVSDVVHASFVDINEEGTEAAAATGVEISLTSLPIGGPPVFVVDHPFMFLIRETATNSILFLGRVNSPPAEGGDVIGGESLIRGDGPTDAATSLISSFVLLATVLLSYIF